MKTNRFKCYLLAAIALHSIVVGAALFAAPAWTLALFGWKHDGPSFFFVEQSGILLVILGFAYGMGVRRRSFAWFLVLSKFIAVIFLVVETVRGSAPPTALVVAFFDGLMGIMVAMVLIREALAPLERPSLSRPGW